MIDEGTGLRTATARQRQPSALDVEQRIAATEAQPPAPTSPAQATQPTARLATQPAPASPSAEPAGPPVPPVVPPVVPEARRGAIDAYVANNAQAEQTFLGVGVDDDGGEVIGRALRGGSELGQLTPGERRYLADRAVAAWTPERNREAVREMTEAVRDDPFAARDVAAALAAPAGRTSQVHARGQHTLHAEGGPAFEAHMLDLAMDLDGAAVIDAFRGAEAELGRRLATAAPADRNRVLDAVSSGQVTGEAADRLVTATFLHGDGRAAQWPEGRQAMARALATVVNTDQSPYRDASRDAIAQRLDGVLASGGGRDLLLDPEVRPEIRSWALAQVAADPALDAAALRDGWEGEAISRRFAQTSLDAYRARGTEPQPMGGEALRNAIGQSMGLPPDRLPPEAEDPAARAARLGAGLDHRYYGDDARIDAVAGRIQELGGEQARVTVLPVTVTSNEFGAATIPVYRVETANGPVVVDDQGLKYDSVEEWAAANRLPPGKMTYPAGLDLAAGGVTTANTPGVVDSFGEHARRIGDGVALAAGIAAGVLVIAGTGGTAAPLVLGGAAAAWGLGTSGADLAALHDRGVDVTDMTNPEVRAHVINVAASTLSLGAMGAAVKLGRARAQATTTAARATAGLQVAANGADAVAMGDQGVQLAQGWDRMSNAERAAGLLNVAFWAGLGAASTHGTGAPVRDAFSFGRLENQVRFGAPYPVQPGADLAPGQVRVAYDAVDGRARNIRIETGAGPIDPAALDLHVATARHVEAAGGLRDRLAAALDDRQPAVGSAAWEARLEIDKIGQESQAVLRELSQPGLTPERQAALEGRQRELAQAINREQARLDVAGALGDGFVAAPRSLTDITSHHVASGAAARGLPPGVAPVAAPSAADPAMVDYGSLNALEQAQGIQATLRSPITEGTGADAAVVPPGFIGGRYNHSRGHLLARSLGGSDDDPRNFVMLFQDATNSPVMSDFEGQVRRAVDAGEVVNYAVTPIYEGLSYPTAVAISARGSNGFSMDVTIHNRDGTDGLGR